MIVRVACIFQTNVEEAFEKKRITALENVNNIKALEKYSISPDMIQFSGNDDHGNLLSFE